MSAELYNLIHSLSGSEKRYIQLSFDSGKELSKNCKLFRIYLSQKKYERKILFDKATELAIDKYYAVSCNDLFSYVLKELRNYYRGQSAESKVRIIIENVELYYKRGFFKLCERELSKGFYLCNKFDLFDYSLILSRKRKTLFKVMHSSVINLNAIQKNFDNDAEIIEKLKLSNLYWLSANNIFHYYREALTKKNQDAVEILKTLFNEEIFQNKIPDNYVDLLTYYTVNIMQAQINGDLKKMNEICKENVEFLENRPYLIKENATLYLKGKYNYIVSFLELKDYPSAEEHTNSLDKCKEIYGLRTSEEIDMLLFQYVTCFRVRLANLQGNFGIAKVYNGVIEAGIKRFGKGNSELSLLKINYNMAYSYFGIGEYKSALRWLNKITSGHIPIWQKGVYHIYLLNYLIHYELGNYELLISLTRNFHRNFVQKTASNPFDKALVRMFKGSTDFVKIIENKEKTISIIEEFNNLKNDPLVQSILENIDLEVWLLSKIHKRSFMKICQEKVRLGN